MNDKGDIMQQWWKRWTALGLFWCLTAGTGYGEVMLQWFSTTWNEMTEKIPILAELGYGSIYVPVPNKAGSIWSVGYDTVDRFDLGDENRNGISTRYGTKQELLRMVETAHRFGIRVYFDNVMNHNSFPAPGESDSIGIDYYPDMLPEDFHVVKDGYYYKRSGAIEGWMYDSGAHKEIQQYTLSDLCDIANESGALGYNWDMPGQPVLSFVRQPNEPDKYPNYGGTPISSGGIDIYPFDGTNGTPSSEDVCGYLIRAVRWTMEETKCDGFRFDAIKHVYPPFFGSQSDDFAGYCGAIQAQYNLTHGMNDSNNRDSCYNVDAPRDDALLFGEAVPHTNLDPYDWYSRGTRLLDFYYEGTMSGVFSQWGYGNMANLLNYGPLGAANGVMQCQNHDHPQYGDMDLMYAYEILRDGIPLIYTDGNNHATPDKWGRVFPEYGRGDFLGQYQNPQLGDKLSDLITRPGPQSELSRAIWIHEQFGHGQLWNKWADEAVVVNERVYTWDYDREVSYDQNAGTVLLTAFCDNKDEWGGVRLGPWDGTGERTGLYTDFRPGTLLFNYATTLNNLSAPLAFTRVESDWRVNIDVPPGHYVAYSMMVPGRAHPGYAPDGVNPVQIEQPGGTPVSWMATYRTDTPQGDSDWNDNGIPNSEDPVYIPRVAGTGDVRFVVVADGLACSAMLKLDGGIPIHGATLQNPPGEATDIYLGYEGMNCLHKRHYANDWYFYKWDHAPGESDDLWWAITSDMDSDPNNDLSDPNSDFSNRSEYDCEFDAYVPVTNFSEGYHMARGRVFRKRAGGPNDGADIYNTFKQTYYVDLHTPEGDFAYPRLGEGLWSSEYGMIFRTDDTVTRVEVHIDDNDSSNDDHVLHAVNGNGVASNGVGEAWGTASRVSPYPHTLVDNPEVTNVYARYPREWRFTYRNIPSSGNAVIKVKLYEASTESNPTHYTLLSRTNSCNAPSYDLAFAYPQDGDSIPWTDYTVVVKFSDSLPKDTGRVSLYADSQMLPRSAYGFYDSGSGCHWMYCPWTNFMRGTHNLTVRYSAGSPLEHDLEASINVETTEEISFVKFIDPPAVDENGNQYTLKLRSPVPRGSSVTSEVVVETSADVEHLLIRISDTSMTNFPWQGFATALATSTTDRITWSFPWLVAASNAGSHTIHAHGDTDGSTATYEVQTSVRPKLEFWQFVDANDADGDDDDDGIPDGWNTTNAPGEKYRYDLFTDKPDSSTWENGDVHKYFFTGRSDPLSPDTDNDGLSDGLELGIGGAFDAGTDTNTDTNADGFPNFQADLDPPVYNTWYHKIDEGLPYVDEGDQFMKIAGTVTDPANADTDYDGLPDGVEDANRNGRFDWPNESDPNNPDTEYDGMLDGTEDADHNGSIAGDVNSNRVYDAGEAWSETDPLKGDTDDDGLPDGWEWGYGLDPLDNGTNSLRTAVDGDGHVNQGADGDPDGDGFSNAQEYANNTNPMFDESSAGEITARTINVDAGPSSGSLAGYEYFEMFRDWLPSDCHVLDESDDSAGLAEDTGDEYYKHKQDDYALSRDIIAFYSRDGGEAQGKYHFRIDVQDLQYQAEEGYVDFYVAIKLGDPDIGDPKAFPDSINCDAEHGWDVLAAVYQSGFGAVHVGDQGASNPYFIGAHFRSDYDSMEFAIDRQALINAGWNGFSELHFQVFTVKDGTCDDCGNDNAPGPGDVGGASDIADAIMDDTRGWAGTLRGYISSSWTANRVKTAVVLHGNQAAQPASTIQSLVYNDAATPAAGYFRPLDAHALFGKPVNLHISGTLASALEWAVSDANSNKNGAAFNDRIGAMIRDGKAALLPGPYADLFLPHFTGAAAGAAIENGRQILENCYGVSYPNWWDVCWLPEQLADSTTLSDLYDKGIYFTVINQWTHLFNWYGRTAAISRDAYNIQEIDSVKCFAISKAASDELFSRHDSGLSMTLRNLLHAKALDAWTDYQRAQVVIMKAHWEDFADTDKASAYDRNLDWMANHPWIQMVTLDAIARGEVDINGDGNGDHWPTINRGSAPADNRQAQEFIQYASEGDFNNWYYGSDLEESLFDWKPLIEGSTRSADVFGHVGDWAAGTMLCKTWDAVENAGASSIGKLAQMHFVSGMFETGWHDEDAGNYTRWSDGTYMYPDSTYNGIAAWVKPAQAHARFAALYERVAAWNSAPPSAVTVTQADVDVDGENEYLLYNRRVYAVFEDNGGRMVAAFVRDPAVARAFQVIGNTLAFPDAETEDEGTSNIDAESGLVAAKQTSGLKDWWAGDSSDYVNDLYSASALANGWTLTSGDGKIAKTVTLSGVDDTGFDVTYAVDASLGALYLRNGLSPNLHDLAMRGQQHLSVTQNTASALSLVNNDFINTVEAGVMTGSGATINTGATDQGTGFAARNMRNQAYVQQNEVYGSGTFAFTLQFNADQTDTDHDGIPNESDPDADGDDFANTVETMIDPLTGLPQSDPYDAASQPILTVHGITRAEDPDDDGDGMPDLNEVYAGTDPHDAESFLAIQRIQHNGSELALEWTTVGGRNYTIEYLETPLAEADAGDWREVADAAFPLWEDSVPGSETQMVYSITASASNQCAYRVQVHDAQN